MRKKIWLVFMVAFVLFLDGRFLYAQPPNPPGGSQPGAEAARFQQATERERKRVEKQKPAPKVEVEKEKVKPVPQGPSFMLKEVEITGTTIFSAKELQATYKNYLGKKVTFEDLQQIAKNIESMYVKRGYLATNAYVPQQDITEAGKVVIAVAEAKMGKLKIEGNKYFNTDFIKRFFHIKKNDLLNFNTLQKDVLRLNTFQDLEVKTVVSPGEEPQTADITLTCNDKMPWHFGSISDNQGTRLTGNYRGGAYVRSTNVSGFGDTVFANTVFSKGSVGQSFSYNLPVDTHGTKIGFDYTYFWMKLLKEFTPFEIRGQTNIYTPHITWEMALTETFSANINAGLYMKSIRKTSFGEKVSDDQLRLPYFGYDITNIDSFLGGGQTSFSPQFIFGTADFLGSYPRNDPRASRPGTGGCFEKYYQTFTRIQRMPFESYISMNSQLQIASRDIPSSEQLQLGGENSIRGYPEGDYLADSGATLNLDWVFPCYIIPKEWKPYHSKTPLRNWIEPCIFMDIGGGHLMRTFPGELKNKFLMGMGGGLRVHIYDKVFLKFEWAVPVGDSPTAGSGPSTFHFVFQADI